MKHIGIYVVSIVFVLGALFIVSGIDSGSGYEIKTALDRLEEANLNHEDDIPEGNLFKGEITNRNVLSGVVRGVGVYDRSCVPVEDGLTQCDAGILTKEYDVLNFNYTHNMATEPCIAPNELLTLEITSETGEAVVKRHSQSLH